MSWRESYQLRDYVNDVLTNAAMRPPAAAGVYLISEHQWHKVPTTDSMILYVGLAGGGAGMEHLRSRIGSLLSDMLGFTDDDPAGLGGRKFCYRHPGGNKLWHWCANHRTQPLELYLGWHSGCSCVFCAEIKLIEGLAPVLNDQIPTTCAHHATVLDFRTNCP